MQLFTQSLWDHLSDWAIFLDIDGTLVDFATTPEEVTLPPGLPGQLQTLYEATGGALALITGRPIESADRLFQPMKLPLAGLHGAEFRFATSMEHPPAASVSEDIRLAAKALAEKWSVFYEEKRLGFGIHYREAPHAEPHIIAALSDMVANRPDLNLLRANMAAEIRPAGIDKGTAIGRFMQEAPYAGRTPLFFGDDVTDDDGFRALQGINGISVVVGQRRPPEADFYLPDTASMRTLLAHNH